MNGQTQATISTMFVSNQLTYWTWKTWILQFMVCEVCEVFLSKVWCLWFSQKFGAIGLTMICQVFLMWNFPDFLAEAPRFSSLVLSRRICCKAFGSVGCVSKCANGGQISWNVALGKSWWNNSTSVLGGVFVRRWELIVPSVYKFIIWYR